MKRMVLCICLVLIFPSLVIGETNGINGAQALELWRHTLGNRATLNESVRLSVHVRNGELFMNWPEPVTRVSTESSEGDLNLFGFPLGWAWNSSSQATENLLMVSISFAKNRDELDGSGTQLRCASGYSLRTMRTAILAFSMDSNVSVDKHKNWDSGPSLGTSFLNSHVSLQFFKGWSEKSTNNADARALRGQIAFAISPRNDLELGRVYRDLWDGRRRGWSSNNECVNHNMLVAWYHREIMAAALHAYSIILRDQLFNKLTYLSRNCAWEERAADESFFRNILFRVKPDQCWPYVNTYSDSDSFVNRMADVIAEGRQLPISLFDNNVFVPTRGDQTEYWPSYIARGIVQKFAENTTMDWYPKFFPLRRLGQVTIRPQPHPGRTDRPMPGIDTYDAWGDPVRTGFRSPSRPTSLVPISDLIFRIFLSHAMQGRDPWDIALPIVNDPNRRNRPNVATGTDIGQLTDMLPNRTSVTMTLGEFVRTRIGCRGTQEHLQYLRRLALKWPYLINRRTVDLFESYYDDPDDAGWNNEYLWRKPYAWASPGSVGTGNNAADVTRTTGGTSLLPRMTCDFLQGRGLAGPLQPNVISIRQTFSLQEHADDTWMRHSLTGGSSDFQSAPPTPNRNGVRLRNGIPYQFLVKYWYPRSYEYARALLKVPGIPEAFNRQNYSSQSVRKAHILHSVARLQPRRQGGFSQQPGITEPNQIENYQSAEKERHFYRRMTPYYCGKLLGRNARGSAARRAVYAPSIPTDRRFQIYSEDEVFWTAFNMERAGQWGSDSMGGKADTLVNYLENTRVDIQIGHSNQPYNLLMGLRSDPYWGDRVCKQWTLGILFAKAKDDPLLTRSIDSTSGRTDYPNALYNYEYIFGPPHFVPNATTVQRRITNQNDLLAACHNLDGKSSGRDHNRTDYEDIARIVQGTIQFWGGFCRRAIYGRNDIFDAVYLGGGLIRDPHEVDLVPTEAPVTPPPTPSTPEPELIIPYSPPRFDPDPIQTLGGHPYRW